MSLTDTVFVARLIGLDVFEPNGDRVGRLRDVVITPRPKGLSPLVVGIVVDTPQRKRLFFRMEKVEDIKSQQIIVRNTDNIKKFEQRGYEKLVAAEIFDREVTLIEDNSKGTIEDVAFTKRKYFFKITDIYIRQGRTKSPLGRFRKGTTRLVPWIDTVHDAQEEPQAATQFIHAHKDENPADFATALTEVPVRRRIEIANELSDERLATVIAEMSDDDQVLIIESLGSERAALVLEEMEPDDAVDLLDELSPAKAKILLDLMDPDDAEEFQRLMAYEDNVAGALMTPEPIILPPEATVAEALAHIQQEDVSPANASSIFICRPPLETPTGTYLGSVHFQQLLRSTPMEQVGSLIDKNVSPVSDQTPVAQVVKKLAAYDMVTIPVVNSKQSLVGAVTVDDVLDEILPEDWREQESFKKEEIEIGEDDG
ncbi:MAG: CBS domain-containing protein [Micrococcaceae bacterium]